VAGKLLIVDLKINLPGVVGLLVRIIFPTKNVLIKVSAQRLCGIILLRKIRNLTDGGAQLLFFCFSSIRNFFVEVSLVI